MRKYIKLKSLMFIFICIFLSIETEPVYGDVHKFFRIGNLQDKIEDAATASVTEGFYTTSFINYDDFSQSWYWGKGYTIAAKNWTDTLGNFHPYINCGSSWYMSNESAVTMPIPDSEGRTIRSFYRYPPPSIIVDGIQQAPPFPLVGDEVNPDTILGTAYQMIESNIQLAIGITIRQRVLGWDANNHDDYLITEFSFVNNGNVDLDSVIELPGNTLDDLYFARELYPNYKHRQHWMSAYGEYLGDSMRIPAYAYLSWYSGRYNFGWTNTETGFLEMPTYIGETVLHFDKSTSDHSDDFSQPQFTDGGEGSIRLEPSILGTWYIGPGLGTAEQFASIYNRMENGFAELPNIDTNLTWPGTHHQVRMEDRGKKYPYEFDWWAWCGAQAYSCGVIPTMALGDSFRAVFAGVMGTITPKTGWEVGKAWKNGDAEWVGEYKLPPPMDSFPDLNRDDNDRAKTSWVETGRDSLFKNSWNAKWNNEHNFQVPIPPPPPSIEISSKPDMILIEWGDESEAVPDFAGYRVYQAEGGTHYTEEAGVVTGDWEMIFECGEGTGNAVTHRYENADANRGVAYYYYVTAFDDGTHPEVPAENRLGVNDSSEVLESGKYLTMTTRPAHLTRPAGLELSAVRVVPNPYNISATGLQYPGEPDKIMFMNLPPQCTIEIYNESGDVVRIIEHTDGSGDEAWADPTGQNFMTSSSEQVVVSGTYIARFITPDGESATKIFYIVR